MRIASINLNQRIGNPASRTRFEGWLCEWKPQLILGQEPWRPINEREIDLRGFALLERTRLLGCWMAASCVKPTIISHAERWQEIRFTDLHVHNVYLSPDSAKARRELLLALADAVQESSAPVLICGDFNLAPNGNDGWYGDQVSKWTSAGERAALAKLIALSWFPTSTLLPYNILFPRGAKLVQNTIMKKSAGWDQNGLLGVTHIRDGNMDL